MKILPLLLVLTLSLTIAAEEAKPNPVVEKAMSAALADAEKGYDAFRAILSKATDKAVKDMEKAKLEVMKKGDLASANELDARIKELKESGLERLVMERRKDGGDLLGVGSGQPVGNTPGLATVDLPNAIKEAMAFVGEKSNSIADRAEKLRFIVANYTKPCVQLHDFYLERVGTEGHYTLRLPALEQLTAIYPTSEKVYGATLGTNIRNCHFKEGSTILEYLAKEHASKAEVREQMKTIASDNAIDERVRRVAEDFCRANKIKFEQGK